MVYVKSDICQFYCDSLGLSVKLDMDGKILQRLPWVLYCNVRYVLEKHPLANLGGLAKVKYVKFLM